MFKGLRWRLLWYQLTVMAAILSIFGIGVYVFFSRNLYRQLDQKLQTLAQAATPSFAQVKAKGNRYLDRVNEVPWRDIFNREQQSLEWFDSEGKPLARRGALELEFKLKLRSQTLEQIHKPGKVRAYTISVFRRDRSDPKQPPILHGFIRASQSMQEIERVQRQLLWGLGMGGIMSLGLASISGIWLTQKAVEPVERSFNYLKQFTADASHELRGPLMAIKVSVQVMRNHPERIHPKDTKKLAAIANATTQMSQLTQDLLFLARTDTDVSHRTQEWIIIPLNKILQDLLELLEPFAQNKEVTLNCQWFAKVSVVGDKAQLNRLFSNLLENAIQYTPSGGSVDIRLSQYNRLAIVSVKDTGIGIEQEYLSSVFNRFWRADKARSRRKGGSGLGLAIAQAIAEHHGGKITVSSKVGFGSCFEVRLPIAF